MAGLLETAASQRAALLRQDRAAGADLLRAYAQVWARLDTELALLTDAIAGAQSAGVALSEDRWRRIVAPRKPLVQALSGETFSEAATRVEVRYRLLRAQLLTEMDRYARTAEGVITGAQHRAITAGLADAEGLLAAATGSGGVGLAFNRLPVGALQELVGVLADGSPLSALLGELGPQADAALREALVTGLGLGKGPRAIALDMRRSTNVTAVRALRISRTEVLRAYRSASLTTYQANGDILRGWQWLASISRRSCPVCIAMSGTIHRLDEPFSSHPACRCCPTPLLRGVTPPVERGEDAFRHLKADDQRAILGPGKYAAWESGAIDSLDDLVVKTRDKTWGPGLRERPFRDVLARPAVSAPPRARALPVGPRGMDGARAFERDGDAVDWAKRHWAPPGEAGTTEEQIAALRQYQSAGYQGVNPHLRGTRAFPAKRVAEMEREVIGPLDTVLAERPVPEDVIAWRGVNRDAFPAMSEQLAGTVFEEQGYLSTALGAKMPRAFDSKDVVMRIRVPAGTPGYFMPNVATDARMRAERELLIGRGQRFIVHGAKYNGRTGKWNLDVELLGPKAKGAR